jgi:DNA-binding NarL/FixJ family response regulator
MSQVLIIEDHPLYSDALKNLLQSSLPRQEILHAPSVEDAVKLVSTKNDNGLLVLLDLTLPGMSGVEAIHFIKDHYLDSHLIVISASDDSLQVSASFGSGAIAFISKNAEPESVIQLIKDVLAGALSQPVWLSTKGRNSLAGLPTLHLTNRQIQVLSLVCQGLKNIEIAEKLNVTEQTTKAHVSAIFKELGVVNRTQALLVAQRLGLKVTASVK